MAIEATKESGSERCLGSFRRSFFDVSGCVSPGSKAVRPDQDQVGGKILAGRIFSVQRSQLLH